MTDSARRPKLNTAIRRTRAIALLLEGGSQREVARALGCSERTVRHYAASPDGRAALEALRARLLGAPSQSSSPSRPMPSERARAPRGEVPPGAPVASGVRDEVRDLLGAA